MGSAFHQLCPRYSGTLTPTAPTAIRLWDSFTFLKEPKRPIITEGTVPEFQVTGSIAAHPGTHQIAYPSYNLVGMACEVSVRNYFDENLITMTYFNKIMMI